MLGVTGAWAAERTGSPVTAGTLCTPDDCTAVADKFPGAVAPLAPEGSGCPPSGRPRHRDLPRRLRGVLPHRPLRTLPELELSVTPAAASTPGFAEAGDLEGSR